MKWFSLKAAKPPVHVGPQAPGVAKPDDAERARHHHAAVLAALGPVMAAMDAAKAEGFDIGFSMGPNAQGNQELRGVDVIKPYRF